MHKFVISAPFGNYLESAYVTSTMGTYTMQNRAGFLRWRLFWRLLRTLRYRRALGGWTNKLGLPNPGIQHLIKLVKRANAICPGDNLLSDKIVSIHGFTPSDWYNLLNIMSRVRPGYVELNISCPNVGHLSVPDDLFKYALNAHSNIIIKLPPVNYWPTFIKAHDDGVRIFHCTNTLPCPAGGLSGKALQGIALDVVRRVKAYDHDTYVIGGGGIIDQDDVKRFRDAGATSFAVGSTLLNPKLWLPGPRYKFFDNLYKLFD